MSKPELHAMRVSTSACVHLRALSAHAAAGAGWAGPARRRGALGVQDADDVVELGGHAAAVVEPGQVLRLLQDRRIRLRRAPAVGYRTLPYPTVVTPGHVLQLLQDPRICLRPAPALPFGLPLRCPCL